MPAKQGIRPSLLWSTTRRSSALTWSQRRLCPQGCLCTRYRCTICWLWLSGILKRQEFLQPVSQYAQGAAQGNREQYHAVDQGKSVAIWSFPPKSAINPDSLVGTDAGRPYWQPPPPAVRLPVTALIPGELLALSSPAKLSGSGRVETSVLWGHLQTRSRRPSAAGSVWSSRLHWRRSTASIISALQPRSLSSRPCVCHYDSVFFEA